MAETDKFCKRCGAPVRPEEPKPVKKTKGGPILLGIAGGFLALILVVSVLGKEAEPTAPAAPEESTRIESVLPDDLNEQFKQAAAETEEKPTETVEAKPEETTPAESAPEAKPAETTPAVESKPAEVEPVVSKPAETGKPAAAAWTLPDPAHYFAGADEVEDKSSAKARYVNANGGIGLKDAAAAYAAYLQDAYGFTLVNEVDDYKRHVYGLSYGGKTRIWDGQTVGNVNVEFHDQADTYGHYMVTVTIYDPADFTLEEGKPYSGTLTSEKSTAATPTSTKPAFAGVGGAASFTIPDPSVFFGGLESEGETTAITGNRRFYDMDIDDGLTAAHEYAELLQDPRFGLKLREKVDSQVLYIIHEAYYFDYTGGEVTPGEDQYYDGSLGGYVNHEADVFLLIEKNALSLYTRMELIYSEDLKLTAVEERASNASSISPGGGSGSGDSSSGFGDRFVPEHSRLDCLECDGSGDCKECGGNGMIQRYGQASEWSVCRACSRSGNCRECGGSGKR